MHNQTNMADRKACIVTVYNSENCGSFWQARALQEYLRENGYIVYFLQRNMTGSSHTIKRLLRSTLSALINRNIPYAVRRWKQYQAFSTEVKVFQVTTLCDRSFDLCILGSDTIWNISDTYFLNERMMYWGEYVNSRKKISYAASVGNTNLSMVQQYPELVDSLKKLDAISVRDYHTLQVIKNLQDKEGSMVCDPTLLYDKSFYYDFITTPINRKYIFVYYFQKMPESLETSIVQYANEHDLHIIVMGESMKTCTVRDYFSPSLFLNRFAYADLVVTNTFHGTIFSTIFEKQAVFSSCGKQKVKDILCRFGLTDHDYDACGNFESILQNEIIYDEVREKVNQFRQESKQFLDNAIG